MHTARIKISMVLYYTHISHTHHTSHISHIMRTSHTLQPHNPHINSNLRKHTTSTITNQTQIICKNFSNVKKIEIKIKINSADVHITHTLLSASPRHTHDTHLHCTHHTSHIRHTLRISHTHYILITHISHTYHTHITHISNTHHIHILINIFKILLLNIK